MTTKAMSRMLIIACAVCVAVGPLASGDDEPKVTVPLTPTQQAILDSDPFIKKAELAFAAEILASDSAFLLAKQKAATRRLATYREQLKAFTKAGDFDKAVACKAAIEILQSSEVEGSAPRPRDTANFGGHTYALIQEPVTWNVAKRRCEMMGGHLACLETQAEAEWAKKLFRANKASGWIGASDEATEGKWLWVTGREIDPRFIKSARIDNHRDSEHWLHFSLEDDNWNDSSARTNFICEWDN